MDTPESAYESIIITARDWQKGDFEEVKEKIVRVCKEFIDLEIEEKTGKLFFKD